MLQLKQSKNPQPPLLSVTWSLRGDPCGTVQLSDDEPDLSRRAG